MNVLIDVNVALDVLLEREPWLADSQAVWDASHQGRITGHLIATGLTNIFYVARRVVGRDKAWSAARMCLATFEIILVDRPALERADALPGNDLEDNLTLACALATGMDAIVTRDPKGFAGSPVPVLTPAELLARLPKAADA